jgi:hypothetical protein
MVGDMGLKSTAVDLTRFTQMLLNDGKTDSGVELLSAASVKLMRTPYVVSTTVCLCLSGRSNSSTPCSRHCAISPEIVCLLLNMLLMKPLTDRAQCTAACST